MTIIKNIFITRHGHSDFNSKTDFERILTKKGIDAVHKTANYIKTQCQNNDITVQLCISSAAIRTKQTANIICETNNILDCNFYQELYSTVVSSWIDKLKGLRQETIIFVGHNPTFSQMVNVLCGYDVQMRPADCAFITLELNPDGIIYPATLNNFYGGM